MRENSNGDGEAIDYDPWYIKNNLLDILLMGAHFIVWTLILWAIEADLGKRMRRCFLCCCSITNASRKKDLKIDPDVEMEA